MEGKSWLVGGNESHVGCTKKPPNGRTARCSTCKAQVLRVEELEPRVVLDCTAFPAIQLERIADGVGFPVDLTHSGDGSERLFVVDLNGTIRVIQDGTVKPIPFLDIRSKVRTGSERGLLGLAFHPDFSVRGATGEHKFYVYYSAFTQSGADHMSVVAEYSVSTMDPNIADASSERILLSFDQPQSNHNGGQLRFGPDDGYLYVGTGDGGQGNDVGVGHTLGLGNAQDRTNLLGSILRIDVDGSNSLNGQYGIPSDNPFVDQGGGVREEIYAYGLRNPWRFSFDDGPAGPASPDRLFAGDVGQNAWEEVDLIVKGGNYGWRIREGAHPNPGDPGTVDPGVPLIDPIAEYPNPAFGRTVIGGYVYRGGQFPSLVGRYIFAERVLGKMLGLDETETGWELCTLDVEGGNPIGVSITAFGEDESQELYVLAGASVYHVLPAAPHVVNVSVQGSSWPLVGLTPFSIAPGDTIPWTDVDELIVTFSEPVTVQLSDLALHGSSEMPAPPAVVAITSDATGMTARLTLAAPLSAANSLLLDLNADPDDPVTDALENALANPTFQFNTLHGDTDGNAAANFGDVLAILSRVPGRSTDNPRADVNADESINFGDALQVLRQVPSSLPPGQPSPAISPGQPIERRSTAETVPERDSETLVVVVSPPSQTDEVAPETVTDNSHHPIPVIDRNRSLEPELVDVALAEFEDVWVGKVEDDEEDPFASLFESDLEGDLFTDLTLLT